MYTSIFCAMFVFLAVDESHMVTQTLTSSQEQQINDFVESLFPCYNPVGVSLAIVRNGESEFTKGYGTLAPGDGTTVTNKTRFCIASCTKAFTSTLLGMLLAENKSLSWDTKVKDILGPSFQVGDPDVTRLANLRDLLAHKTGISRHDVNILFGTLDRKTHLRKLRFYTSYKEFRSTFLYSNSMYGVAGRVAEVLGGKSYETLVRERIFQPLEMEGATFIQEENDTMPNMAKPFIFLKKLNQTKEISKEILDTIETTSAAASICASAEDMTKWMNFHLSLAKNDSDNKTTEQDVILETYKPQMVVSEEFAKYILHRPDYPVTWSPDKTGLGWLLGYYRGYPLISHSGNLIAYGTLTTIFASHDVGVFVSATGIPWPDPFLEKITMFVADVLLEEEPWLNTTNSCSVKFPSEKKKENKTETTFGKSTRPEKDYYGTYGNVEYGNATVSAYANQNQNITVLHMQIGPLGNFTLTATTTKDVFELNGIGKSWFFQQDIFSLGQVNFTSSNNDSIVDKLLAAGLDKQKPVFVRGLKMPSEPDTGNGIGPSTPCTPPTPSSGDRSHPQSQISLISVVMILYIIS